MIKKFPYFFEYFKRKENIDSRLFVCEYFLHNIDRSLKIKVCFSDERLAERFKNELMKSSIIVKDNVKIVVLPENRINKYGLVNVFAASVVDSPRFKSNMVTQTLLGEKVDVLQYDGDWLRIRCIDGYIGWVNHSQVVLFNNMELSQWENKKFFLFRDIIGNVREKPNDSSLPLRLISVSCKLPYLKKKGEWINVMLPDNLTGWVKNKNMFKWLDQKEKSIGERIVLTSKNFLGIPYLWGGKSPMGFDCSGFVQMVFLLNDIFLPRDSDMQYNFSKESSSDMKKADLLFFGREKVSHVGIYIGNKRFIHSKGFVRISSLDKSDIYYDGYLKKTFIECKSVM
jgi:SH3-like domain-containing protein